MAAEVCMEAKVNLAGYHALKVLDKSGDLRFELGYVGSNTLFLHSAWSKQLNVAI